MKTITINNEQISLDDIKWYVDKINEQLILTNYKLSENELDAEEIYNYMCQNIKRLDEIVNKNN